MGLDIASIQDVNLQKFANDIDKKGNNNGKLDQAEIGQLLTQKTENDYEIDEYRLFATQLENMFNENKVTQEEMINGEKKKTTDDKLIKTSGAFALLGGILNSMHNGAFSFKYMLRGGAIGSMIGLGLAAFTACANKALDKS